MTRAGLGLWWVLTRVLAVALLVALEGNRGVVGDLNYFSQALAEVSRVGLAHTLVEYPLPAVAVVAFPMGLAVVAGSSGLYPLMLVACALVTDALFTVFLYTVSHDTRRASVWFWLIAVPLLGGLSLARFDLLAGILAAVAIVLVSRRTRLAMIALSAATAIKLWPVLLVPGVVAGTRRRVEAAAVVLVLGVFLAGGTALLGGWGRVVSPLTYQSDRGLQVESILATPAMVGWGVDPDRWRVSYAASRSFEISGAGTSALLTGSTLLTLALLGGFALMCWRALRNTPELPVAGVVWFCLAVTSGFLVSAKVLSPQYLLWLLPVVAVGLAVAPSRALVRWTVVVLAVTVLTHLIYPWAYRGLVEHGWQTAIAVPALVIRNVLVVGLLVLAAREAWRLTGTQPRTTEQRLEQGS